MTMSPAHGPDRQFNLLPDVRPGAEALPDLDPAMKHATCRFQLSEGPVLFDASIPVPFWSIGLFNAAGEAVYSLNNRTAGAERLSMLVLTTEQLSILRENPPENLEDLIVIETEEPISGFALLTRLCAAPDTHPAPSTVLCNRPQAARESRPKTPLAGTQYATPEFQRMRGPQPGAWTQTTDFMPPERCCIFLPFVLGFAIGRFDTDHS